MRFLIRADASQLIGSGHVMRCLSVSHALCGAGHEVHFFTVDDTQTVARSLLGNSGLNEVNGFFVHYLVGGHILDELGDARAVLQMMDGEVFDIALVDHYALGGQWESEIKKSGATVAVIDDLANRAHDCALLMDQTYGRQACDYEALVPEKCEILTGAEYALLRPEFAAAREEVLRARAARGGVARNILISTGGTNLHNITGRILQIFEVPCEYAFEIDILLGNGAMHVDAVMQQIEKIETLGQHRIHLHSGVKDVVPFMATADIAIGAAGTTSWERCCLGLPTILLVLADNQELIATKLGESGAVLNMGDFHAMDIELLSTAFYELCVDTEEVMSMQVAAAEICDGRGMETFLKSLCKLESKGGCE